MAAWRFLPYLSLLILIPIVSAIGIGISPSSVEFVNSTEKEIMIFNSGERVIEISHHPNDFVDLVLEDNQIPAYGMTNAKLKLRRIPKQDIKLRIFGSDPSADLAVGTDVPISARPRKAYSVVEVNQKKETGILIIASIVFMGAALYCAAYSFIRSRR